MTYHSRHLVLVFLTAFACATAQPARADYDGYWWSDRGREERLGFLAGIVDCSMSELDRKIYRDIAWEDFEPLVGAYYAKDPVRRRTDVVSVLADLVSTRSLTAGPSGGEEYPGKHGVFIGEMWRQSSPMFRLGFVAGFIRCYKTLPKRHASFDEPPASYVMRISSWYGVTEDLSKIDEDKIDTPIADVLFIVASRGR